jgi:hypothetical protein
VKYTGRPDFSAIYSQVGFYQTELQAIAGATKPCVDIPCPDDLQECRMDVVGLCLRTPLLVQKGWPEKVEEFVQYALLAHAHKVNAMTLAKMEALSTAVTIAAPPAPDPAASITDPLGPGMTETILGAIELQVQYMRYAWRLSQGAVMEAVAPYWLRSVIRSDISKKLGWDVQRWNAADSLIDSWFAIRGIRIQWIYDWQDCMATGDAADFGCAPPTRFPDSVKIMIFEPGTFFRLQADVITIDGLYDTASLQKNMATRLFTEEGWQVCTRCGQSVVLEVPLCPNGLSGAPQTTQCE